MKTITATILLTFATSQVNADGFYQQIVGSAPQASQQVNIDSTETNYSPLYTQVTSSVANLASQEKAGPSGEFTYTPLYLQVVGNEKAWSRTEKIAQVHNKF